MTNEEKAKSFLEYVGKHEKELRKNLIKNITYNADIFEDIFNDTIVKIYDSIIRNGTEIKDFKQYFFICAKYNYIICDNKNKKYKSKMIYDYFDKNDIVEIVDNVEHEFNNTVWQLNYMQDDLIEKFGAFETELFFTYYTKKSEGRMSYKKIAKEYNISSTQATEIIKRIKQYINNNYAYNKAESR